MTELVIFLTLLAFGYGVGRYRENKHYASILEREAATLHLPAVSLEKLPDDRPLRGARLVTGSVVISIDYYKRFLAGVRCFFGGELRSYAPLIDRARREAILRMKESCPEAGLFLNLRVETSSISKGERKAIGSVEALAYSTALIYADEVRS